MKWGAKNKMYIAIATAIAIITAIILCACFIKPKDIPEDLKDLKLQALIHFKNIEFETFIPKADKDKKKDAVLQKWNEKFHKHNMNVTNFTKGSVIAHVEARDNVQYKKAEDLGKAATDLCEIEKANGLENLPAEKMNDFEILYPLKFDLPVDVDDKTKKIKVLEKVQTALEEPLKKNNIYLLSLNGKEAVIAVKDTKIVEQHKTNINNTLKDVKEQFVELKNCPQIELIDTNEKIQKKIENEKENNDGNKKNNNLLNSPTNSEKNEVIAEYLNNLLYSRMNNDHELISENTNLNQNDEEVAEDLTQDETNNMVQQIVPDELANMYSKILIEQEKEVKQHDLANAIWERQINKLLKKPLFSQDCVRNLLSGEENKSHNIVQDYLDNTYRQIPENNLTNDSEKSEVIVEYLYNLLYSPKNSDHESITENTNLNQDGGKIFLDQMLQEIIEEIVHNGSDSEDDQAVAEDVTQNEAKNKDKQIVEDDFKNMMNKFFKEEKEGKMKKKKKNKEKTKSEK